jgi:hypothetical protein
MRGEWGDGERERGQCGEDGIEPRKSGDCCLMCTSHFLSFNLAGMVCQAKSNLFTKSVLIKG